MLLVVSQLDSRFGDIRFGTSICPDSGRQENFLNEVVMVCAQCVAEGGGVLWEWVGNGLPPVTG